MKKKEKTHKLKIKTGGGRPLTPSQFTEEDNAVASVMSRELKDVFDTPVIQEGHPVAEAGSRIVDGTLSEFVIVEEYYTTMYLSVLCFLSQSCMEIVLLTLLFLSSIFTFYTLV